MVDIKDVNLQAIVRNAQLGEARGVSPFSPVLLRAYRLRFLRPLLRKLILRLEGGRFFSRTYRRLLLEYHGVSVGMYSYGPCLVPGLFPPGTVVGNYCSLGFPIHIYRRDHTIDRISHHPFFYNSECGLLDNDTIEAVKDNPLTIGHEVFIGSNTIILSKCRNIGDGAVIGSGSVVTRDVEPFTIVAGNPARVIRKRFPVEIEEQIRQTQWWNYPIPELMQHLECFLHPAALENVLYLFRNLPPQTNGKQDRKEPLSLQA